MWMILGCVAKHFIHACQHICMTPISHEKTTLIRWADLSLSSSSFIIVYRQACAYIPLGRPTRFATKPRVWSRSKLCTHRHVQGQSVVFLSNMIRRKTTQNIRRQQSLLGDYQIERPSCTLCNAIRWMCSDAARIQTFRYGSRIAMIGPRIRSVPDQLRSVGRSQRYAA